MLLLLPLLLLPLELEPELEVELLPPSWPELDPASFPKSNPPDESPDPHATKSPTARRQAVTDPSDETLMNAFLFPVAPNPHGSAQASLCPLFDEQSCMNCSRSANETIATPRDAKESSQSAGRFCPGAFASAQASILDSVSAACPDARSPVGGFSCGSRPAWWSSSICRRSARRSCSTTTRRRRWPRAASAHRVRRSTSTTTSTTPTAHPCSTAGSSRGGPTRASSSASSGRCRARCSGQTTSCSGRILSGTTCTRSSGGS